MSERQSMPAALTWARRWGSAFVLFNGVTITAFALGALVVPAGFWELLGVTEVHLPLARVMAWYLLIFGVGGLAIWRHPARHPWVVLLMGLEKLAPAVVFPWLTLEHGAHWLLLSVGVADGLLALVLIPYGCWLRRESGGPGL